MGRFSGHKGRPLGLGSSCTNSWGKEINREDPGEQFEPLFYPLTAVFETTTRVSILAAEKGPSHAA